MIRVTVRLYCALGLTLISAACTPAKVEHNIHEFAVFSFKPGHTHEQELETMAKITTHLSRLEGFRAREYFYSAADKRWVDHVTWASMENARASEHVLDTPEGKELFGQFDPASVNFSRYAKVEVPPR